MSKSKPKSASTTSKLQPTKKPVAEGQLSEPGALAAPATLLGRLPTLDTDHRAAYLSQFTDAECTSLGEKTRSAAVRAAALAWAAEATPTLLGPHAKEIDYAPKRLAWLVELITSLDAERSAGLQKNTLQSSVRSERDVSRVKGQELKQRLAQKLSRVVKGNAVATQNLAAVGATATDEELAGALTNLARLTDGLLKSADKGVAILAETANVTAADADAARAAARSLGQSRDSVALGGRAHGDRDTPEINRVEGRVLHELVFLRNAFDEARSRGVPVPALVPTPGVQVVLGRSHPKKSSSKTPDAPAAPAPR
jgi:hypothetical protein